MSDMEDARPARENKRGPATVATGPTVNKPRLLSRRTILLLASGPLAWALSQVLGRSAPGVVEALYGGAVGAALGGALARASGWIAFSVAEWALAAFVIAQLVRLGRSCRGPAPRRRAMGRALLRVTRDCSVAVAIFYMVWGLHYARPRLPDREQWPALDVDVELLAALAQEQVDAANRAYRALHGGVDDIGRPTPWEADGRGLDRALDAAWPAVTREMHLPTSAAWPRGPVKPLLLSPLLHRLGLSGFYFPFTGEANVNDTVPAVRRAHVMAHEKAHQRGVGPEDEANFLGWRVAATAEHPLANYAAAAFAQGQLVNTLARHDLERARALHASLLPGIQRDLEDVRDYWNRTRGPARDLSRKVNHAYLRSNRVEGGVESYSRSAQLLVRFARTRGDDLRVGPSDSTAFVPSSGP